MEQDSRVVDSATDDTVVEILNAEGYTPVLAGG